MTTRAWAFASIAEEDRSFFGNFGYPDITGSTYHWDSGVVRASQPQAGDLIFLRDATRIVGVAWLDSVESSEGFKARRRCPGCNRAELTPRKSKSPAWRCNQCKGEFDEPVVTSDPVTLYVGEYSRTWQPAPEAMSKSVLEVLYETRDNQSAIRPLDFGKAQSLVAQWLGLGPQWIHFGSANTTLPSGHSVGIAKKRKGQAEFRKAMKDRFGETCAFSGPQPDRALEAAHLYSYATMAEHDVEGGLLLRRDLHALFDAFLLSVEPGSATIRIAPQLASYPELASLEGAPLQVASALLPNAAYFTTHFAIAQEKWARQN